MRCVVCMVNNLKKEKLYHIFVLQKNDSSVYNLFFFSTIRFKVRTHDDSLKSENLLHLQKLMRINRDFRLTVNRKLSVSTIGRIGISIMRMPMYTIICTLVDFSQVINFAKTLQH